MTVRTIVRYTPLRLQELPPARWMRTGWVFSENWTHGSLSSRWISGEHLPDLPVSEKSITFVAELRVD